MDPKLTWSTLCFCLIVQINCDHHLSKQGLNRLLKCRVYCTTNRMPQYCAQFTQIYGVTLMILQQDVALLTNEKSPKCFARNLDALSCFWEAPEGNSYEFFYIIDEEESRCNVSEQEIEKGRIFHVCFFPPSDVFLYTLITLRVVDTSTNTSIYNRTIGVEEQILLDPPSNMTLHLTGKVGQLLVRWPVPAAYTVFAASLQYEIRYASKALKDTVVLVKAATCEHTLLSLVPGEIYTVQMRLKPNSQSFKGHWSDWSPSVTARVPEPAEHVELECHTPDLRQVQCRWNEDHYGYGNYILHYRQTSGGTWGSWRICGDCSTMQCVLKGENSTMFEVYLRAELKFLTRTFYMDMFSMKNSIKTKAPDGLKDESDGERHCLRWNSPLLLISQHLNYQIRYQLQGESDWKLFTALSPKTNTCLDVQVGSQYTVQVKATPNGSFYSGHWSAWSKCLIVHLPLNTGLLFIACVPFVLLIISILLLSFFSRNVSKLKRLLWPPVPNLNEILESFLKDSNGQHWEPNFNPKLDDEDITSMVEIIPEGDTQLMRKPYNCPRFPKHGSLAADNEGEYAVEGLEVSREYVTLNSGEVLPCLTGNDYFHKISSSSGKVGEKLCSCSSACYPPYSTSTTDILNHTYVQAGFVGTSVGLVEIPDRLYTNLEHTAVAESEE